VSGEFKKRVELLGLDEETKKKTVALLAGRQVNLATRAF
jgi:hypothetical protein